MEASPGSGSNSLWEQTGNILWQKEIICSLLKTEQGHCPALRPSSQDLFLPFPFHRCFWPLLSQSGLFELTSVSSHPIAMCLWRCPGCFHTNCGSRHVFLSKSGEAMLTVEGQRSWRCCCGFLCGGANSSESVCHINLDIVHHNCTVAG